MGVGRQADPRRPDARRSLTSVAEDAELVRQYPLLPPAAAAVSRGRGKHPWPAAALHTAAGAAGPGGRGRRGPLVDRGPGKIAVTPHGSVSPLADAGGRIGGVYLHGEGPEPGTLELPAAFFQENAGAAGFQHPRLDHADRHPQPGRQPAELGLGAGLVDPRNDTTVMLPSVPVRRQIVNTVIAPRRWQSLTL